MTFSEELAWRGLIKDATFQDESWLNTPRTFYHGVDPTSDSLTIGNLAALILAKRFIVAGWKPVLLVGGATSLIGDPGGKNEERPLKPQAEIEQNVGAIEAQVKRLFDGADFTLVNNIEWLRDIPLLDFLRDVGKHYAMSELVAREFITERISADGGGISFTEFSYTLLQGYDYWHLYKKFGVELQIGGSDQWGNMISGVGLIRKKEAAEAHALSMPLVINAATGRKFGKSEDGAIWLDGAKTSPYRFYQFWLNVDDQSVIDYLKIYTMLGKDEIEVQQDRMKQDPGSRPAQKALAYEVTKLVHGADAVASVVKVTEVLFGNQNYHELAARDFETLKKELPVAPASAATSIVELMVQGGLAGSNSEARRFMDEGAVYINGLQFSRDKTTLSAEDAIAGHVILRRGKNTQMIVTLEQ